MIIIIEAPPWKPQILLASISQFPNILVPAAYVCQNSTLPNDQDQEIKSLAFLYADRKPLRLKCCRNIN
jgi:hypothetical protein